MRKGLCRSAGIQDLSYVYGNTDRTAILFGWLMFRLLFFDSTVVIDKYESMFILWVHITLSAFVPGAQIA